MRCHLCSELCFKYELLICGKEGCHQKYCSKCLSQLGINLYQLRYNFIQLCLMCETRCPCIKCINKKIKNIKLIKKGNSRKLDCQALNADQPFILKDYHDIYNLNTNLLVKDYRYHPNSKLSLLDNLFVIKNTGLKKKPAYPLA